MRKAPTVILGVLLFFAFSPLPVFAQPSCVSVTGVATVLGSVTITAASFSGITSGMTVSGPGIAAGTTVTSVTSTSITLSAAATATGIVNLSFCVPATTGVPEFGLGAIAVAALSLAALLLLRSRIAGSMWRQSRGY